MSWLLWDMSTGMQMPFCNSDFISFRYILGTGDFGDGCSIFAFLRNVYIVFHSGCTSLHSHVTCNSAKEFPFLHISFVFSIIAILLNSFRITAKLSGKYREFPYIPYPPLHTTSPTIDILHHSGTFVTVSESTLTHHFYPNSMLH